MSATMAPKQRRPGRPKGSLRKPDAININAWVRNDLGLAFEKFVAASNPAATKTAALESILQEFLLAHGYLEKTP